MKLEKATISNQHYEILHVANKLSVPVWFVHMAKSKTSSSDRITVEEWIKINWERYKDI